MSTTNQPNKFTRFVRNNAALLLMIFCIVAIVTVVLVVSLTDNGPNSVISKPVENPNGGGDGDGGSTQKPTPAPSVKVFFQSPLDYTAVSMGYTDGTDVLFVFNSTLDTWQSHKGVDLVAEEGAEVSAMLGGTVVEVSESYGMGNVVKIDHGNNVVATYASLADVNVVQGQVVNQGDKIGTVGTTASYEFADGAHLHLEICVDGKAVDPMPYVNGQVEVEKDASTK